MADRSFLGDSGFDANNQKITNLAAPTVDSDAATRAFSRNASNLNTGTAAATVGGTGITSYAVGDLLYASSTTALSKLAGVATGNALISGGANTAPAWGKVGLTTHISGTLAAANGGTGFASYAVGDILYASTTSALSTLAGVATGNVLISGGVSTAPSWGKVGLTTHISGTLALGNGGTGATTQAGAANAILPSQTSQSGKYLTTDGTNVSWGTVSGGGTTTNALTFNNAGSGAASGSTFNGSAAVTISHNTIGAPARASFPANNESTLDAADLRTITNPTTGLGYAGGMRVRFSSLNDDNASPWADVIDLSTYTDNTGGGFNALYFGKNSQVMQHKYAAAAGTSWTTKTLAYTDSNITGTAANVTGTVAVANGGTGSTTQAGARTGLGATTVGANLFTLTNPSAITFLRVNADNTVSALDAATFRTAIGAGTSSTTGTVTSVSGTGTVSGLTLSGTVTSTGNLTLGGTLSVAASALTGTIDMARLLTAGGGVLSVMASYPRQANAVDVNTLQQSGTYGLDSTMTNGPSGATSYGTLFVQRNSSDVWTQVFVPRVASDFIRYRAWTSAAWTAWQTVVDAETTQTISGAKSFSSFIALSNVSLDKKLQFQRTGGNQHSFELSTTVFGLYNETAAAWRWVMTNAGDMVIGATSAANGAKLDVVGKIRAGSATSTNGSVVLESQYSNGAIAVWGTNYSSGGPTMSYGLRPSTTTTNTFVSASGVALTRGAYSIDGNVHRWFGGDVQTVTEGGAVTVSEFMTLSAAGLLSTVSLEVGKNTQIVGGIARGGSGLFDLQIKVASGSFRVINAAYSTALMTVAEGTGNGTFTGSVTATNFLLSSDARFKTNLTPITHALAALDTITAYRYLHLRNKQQEVGVLAQEVREVLPEAVCEDDEGMLSVAYDRLVPLLLAAVKELSAQVKQLQSEA